MENQNLTFAGATSATAESVAALLHSGPALVAGPARAGGSALATRPCPVPVALRPAGADVRPIAVAPIRGRVSATGLSLTSLDQAWMPPATGVDQTHATTVFSKYTHMFAKHDPGETALRPPV